MSKNLGLTGCLLLGNEDSNDRCMGFSFQALVEYVECLVVGFKELIRYDICFFFSEF